MRTLTLFSFRSFLLSNAPPQPPPHHTGAIHLIMGPMFSGKTRELKRRIDVKRIASARKEMKCLLVKYKKDTRYHSL
jgi:hypothetical protein